MDKIIQPCSKAPTSDYSPSLTIINHPAMEHNPAMFETTNQKIYHNIPENPGMLSPIYRPSISMDAMAPLRMPWRLIAGSFGRTHGPSTIWL